MSLWSSPAGITYINATAAEAPLIPISGLTKVLLIALLAAPIWLFGLLIGLLLPKGFSESRAASVATETASSISDIGSDVAAYSAQGGPSSRPLSDDELAASEADDAWAEAVEAPFADNSTNTTAVGPASSEKPAATAAGSTVRRTVAWAQQLLTFGGSLEPAVQPYEGKELKVPLLAAAEAPAGPATPFAAVNNPSSTAASAAAPRLANGVHTQATGKARSSHAPALANGLPPAAPAAAAAGVASQWSAAGAADAQDSHVWYVGLPDLARFSSTVEPVQDRLLSGKLGQGWSMVMDKDVPGVVRYVSYMRPTDSGSTDYLSVTIVPNATAQEIHEFNLDDVCRSRWDPMLKSTWLLGSRQLQAAEQLVVWLRSFPMGFLSDRLYAGIARRTIADPRDPHCLYGVSKVVHTPVTAAWAAENFPGVIQTDNYYSAWRCRTIPSPWDAPHSSSTSNSLADSSSNAALGGGQPACELVLLHHDELKVPESLSRMAIKLGMWKFVQGMVNAAGSWLEERRSRADPFTDDPAAACRQPAPPLTGAAALAAAEGAAAAHEGGPGASSRAPGSSSSRIDALLGNADALVTPRRLVAVPTAPDLLSLAGIDSDDDLTSGAADVFCEPLTGAAAAGAAPVAAATPRAARLQVSGHRTSHRRASSMDWAPKPDSNSSSSSMQGIGRRSAEARHPKAAAAAAAAAAPAGPQDVVHVALPPISTARQDTPDLGAQQAPPPQQGQPPQQQQQQGRLHFVRGLVGLPALAQGAAGSIGSVVGNVRGRAADALIGLGRQLHMGEGAGAAPEAPAAGTIDAAAPGAAGSDSKSQIDAVKGSVSSRDQGVHLQPAGLQTAIPAAAPAVGEWSKPPFPRSKSTTGLAGKGSSSSGRATSRRMGVVPQVFRAVVQVVAVAAVVVIGAGLAGVKPGEVRVAGDGEEPIAQKHRRRTTGAARS